MKYTVLDIFNKNFHSGFLAFVTMFLYMDDDDEIMLYLFFEGKILA